MGLAPRIFLFMTLSAELEQFQVLWSAMGEFCIYLDRGPLVSPAFAESFASKLNNCRVVRLGSGIHYLQEDHPEGIGTAVRQWLSEISVAAAPAK